MSKKLLVWGLVCLLSVCIQGRADFKYVQSGQITGGMMAGMIHFMGHFNKQMNQPMTTTTYVKGAYLRTDNSDGSYRIIDLNGRRMIEVNPAKHSYSVATFEQLRQMAQQMAQAFTQGVHKQSQQENTQVTMTPQIEVTPTGRSQTLLGLETQEVKTRVALNVQATDAQHGTQSGTLWTDLDSWIAPSVEGYKEVADFNKKMATEIGWTPSSSGMDPRMRNAMVQLYKNGKIPQGLPLLQVMSLVTVGQAQSPPAQQQPEQTSGSSGTPTTPNEAAMKALGGMFGHFGHKKKKNQDEDQQQTDQNSPSSANGSGSNNNSLMEITTRIVSYSRDPLNASLFQIPAGYTETPSDVKRALAGGSR